MNHLPKRKMNSTAATQGRQEAARKGAGRDGDGQKQAGKVCWRVVNSRGTIWQRGEGRAGASARGWLWRGLEKVKTVQPLLFDRFLTPSRVSRMANGYVPPSLDRTNEGRTPLHAFPQRTCLLRYAILEINCAMSPRAVLLPSVTCPRLRRTIAKLSLYLFVGHSEQKTKCRARVLFFFSNYTLTKSSQEWRKASRVCPLRKGRPRKHLQTLLLPLPPLALCSRHCLATAAPRGVGREMQGK